MQTLMCPSPVGNQNNPLLRAMFADAIMIVFVERPTPFRMTMIPPLQMTAQPRSKASLTVRGIIPRAVLMGMVFSTIRFVCPSCVASMFFGFIILPPKILYPKLISSGKTYRLSFPRVKISMIQYSCIARVKRC